MISCAQVICLLFQAQLQLAEGGRAAAAESLSAAQAALSRLVADSGDIGGQLALHVLLLETIRQLADGEIGTSMLTGVSRIQPHWNIPWQSTAW